MHRKFFTDNTGFYRQIFKLALPIVIQNLLSAAVSSADIVMLNYVGQSSISAVSLASQYASVLFMVYYGLGTGATMLCAQYFGKGDMHAIEVVEGIALRFSLVISLAFASVALLIPELMMKVFTNDPELITLGFLFTFYEYHLFVLGYYRGLSGCAAEYRKSNCQHGS